MSSSTALLATSRQRLGVDGETVVAVPPLDHADYSNAKAIATCVKLSQMALGTMVQSYNFHAVRRLLEYDAETDSLEAATDDPLATLLIESSKKLRYT